MLAPLIIRREEAIRLKEAIKETGLSDSTLRRWNRRYAIGRQSAANAPIELSFPALAMLVHGDFEALERLRCGDRADERVRRYFDLCGVPA